MALLDGKQLRNQSTSLDKLSGTGLVTFTSAATMSFSAGTFLRQADENILDGHDVVNKNYVDSVAQGLNIKESVHVVANSSITLSGTQSIDNHVVEVGERVLVNGQDGVNATASNGIYVVSAGAWSRANDADGVGLFGDVQVGDFVFVGHGDLYQGTGWVLNTTDSSDLDILVGTESQHWTQFSSAGVITAGDGLGQTGVDLYVNTGIGLTISADFVRIADTTVTAGNYGTAGSVAQFTVNAQGQLVGATSVSIDINSGQINDFDTAAQASIFTTGNFVDGSTVDFTVTTGDSVSAEVTLGSLTASRLNIINPGSASQDWKLGYNASGQFEWFDPTQGDISEVVAGNGLTGGGVAGVVTLDVNVDNGLSIVSDNVELGGTLNKNTSIQGAGFDFKVEGANDISLTSSNISELRVKGSGGLDNQVTVNTGGIYSTFQDNPISSSTIVINSGGVTLNTFDGVNNSQIFIYSTYSSVSDGSTDNIMVIEDQLSSKGLVYFDDYTGNFTTHSLVTKQYVDAAVAVINADFITGVTAGNGLSGGGTSGFVTLDVNLGVNSGLTFSGDDIIVDTNIAGNGLDISNGVLTVNTSEITSALAGNGLTANGSTLDVNVNSDSLEIISDVIRLKDTITGNRTFQDSVTIGGNLTVNGTTSYVQTENLYVEDNVITLNATWSGSPVLNAGIEVNRGTDPYASLIWNESTDLWSAGVSGSEVSILLNTGNGLVKDGATVSLDYVTITGVGLTQNGTVISVDTTGFASVLAGDGLSANGGTLSVNVANGLSIVSDNVELGGTLNKNTTIDGATFDFSIGNAGTLAFTASNGADVIVESGVSNAENKLQITNVIASLKSGDVATFSVIRTTYNDSSLNSESNGVSNSIRVTNDSQTLGGIDGSTGNYLLVKDNIANKGLVYEGDYTANFTTFSLVTKAYVDSAVSGVGATNGITELTPGVIGLGGSLGQNTTIDGAAYDLTIQDFDILTLTGSVVDVQLDNGLFLVDAGIGGSIDLYGGDVTIFATGSVDITTTNEFTISTATGSITTSNLEGLVYTADYSSTFVNNSLVSKLYVDNTLSSNLILGVTAGQGISGGGTFGDISLAVELSGVSGLTFSGAGDAGTLEVSVDGSTIQINPSGQLTVVAGASQPVYDGYTASATSGNAAIVTGTTLSATPNDYSRIEVYVNGQRQRLDGTTTRDCYFSGDGGTTAIALSSLVSGAQLYWNGNIAGFDLSTTDIVEIVYEA